MVSKAIRRARRDTPMGKLSGGLCLACGERGPHFVPPSFGDIGFYTCQPIPPDLQNHTRCRPPFDHEHADHFDFGGLDDRTEEHGN